MEYRWEFEQTDEALSADLQKALGVHPVLCRLLVQRGIRDYESAQRFFRPSLEYLHNPLLMSGMEQALDRLEQAIEHRERVMIYGDYDVDGTTAVALVYSFLSEMWPELPLDYYIPDRESEGYGLSEAGVAFAAESGTRLIIALDCGIRALERAAEIAETGMDLIICDHHLPGEELPRAVAILDPKQSHCSYPYKDLCGCGIGFKLLQGLSERRGLDKGLLLAGLDLVAVSIAADIVPITGENRVLAWHGLKRLENSPRPGLKALLKQAGVRSPLTIRDLVFGLAPRINAAGRMGHARDAVAMLLSTAVQSATSGAGALQVQNNERKLEDRQTTREALEQMQSWPDRDLRYSTVVYSPDWHKGVIGIVASRLIEHHYRPTIVLSSSNGQAVGSARSVPGFDIHEAISSCKDLLDRFGGHAFAAGLSLPVERIELFRQRFEEAVRQRIHPDLLVPRLKIDAELCPGDIVDRFYSILRQFEPFGPGNPSPVFASRSVIPKGTPRVLKEEHLKLQVGFQGSNSLCLDGIAFGQAKALPLCTSGKTLALAYHLEENHWNGRVSLQLQVKSIREASALQT